MNYYQVLATINGGQLAPIYLLYGEEPYLNRRLIEAMEQQLLTSGVDDFNYDFFDGEETGLGTVLEAAGTLPVFAEKRLVVVQKSPWFQSKSKSGAGEAGAQHTEPLLAYVKQPAPSTVLVFWAEGKVDKRLKVYKELAKSGLAWDSQPLAGAGLAKFIRDWLNTRGKTIAPEALQNILMGQSGDLQLMVQELEKLYAYLGEKKQADSEDVQAVMVFDDQNSIFALTDAVGRKEKGQAVWLLRKMFAAGETPLYVLAMVTRQLRLILNARVWARAGYSQQQIASQIKSHPYAVRKALDQAKYYQDEELIAALEQLLVTDVALKRGGGEPATLLEQAVLELCS